MFWAAPQRAKSDLIVVTENNTVYALNAVTGAVDWQTSLGPSVPGSALGVCGSRYDPAGVTGTPVIDLPSSNIYFAGLMNTPAGPRAVFNALRLVNGKKVPGFPVDIQNQLGGKFSIDLEGQHSALAISNGRVYAGYSAQAKDCGAYNGMVVSVPIYPGPSTIQSWSAKDGGGVWGAAGIINDGDSLLIGTCNTRNRNS